MNTASIGDIVTITYTGHLEDGTVFDSSREQGNLVFTLGKSQVISGLENAVRGMSPGQRKTVTIPPEQGYGLRHNTSITMPLPQDHETKTGEIGDLVQLQGKDNQTITAIIKNITDTEIHFDPNHPLSGKTLHFDIELISIE